MAPRSSDDRFDPLGFMSAAPRIRRWPDSLVRIGCVAAFVVLSLAVPASAQYARVAQKVARDAYKAYQLIDWGIDAARALRVGEEPPPYPPGIELTEQVDRIEEAVAQLGPIALERAVPSFSGGVPSDRDQRRALLARHTQSVLAGADELELRQGEIADMKESETQLAAMSKAMREVGEILLETAQYVPLPQLQLVFVGYWYDIEAVYRPRIDTAKGRVAGYVRESERIRRNRAGALSDLANMLLPTLAAERASVEAEQRDLKQRMEAFIRALADLEVRKRALVDLRVAIQARELDIAQLEDQAADSRADEERLRSRRRRLVNERSDAIDERAQPYNLCPNHHPYNTCKHTDRKQLWDARQHDLSARIQRLGQQINELGEDIDAQLALTQRLEHQAQRNRVQLATEKREAEREERAITARSTELEKTREALWKEFWTSRTTAIYDASELDSTQLLDTLARVKGRGHS